MPIEWTPDLAIDHPEIDRQHEHFFQLFSELTLAIQRRAGLEEVGRVLSALSVFVGAHFRMEEELMRSSDYPGLQAHIADHEVFRAQVEAMVDQYRRKDFDATLLLRVMRGWITGHVQTSDREMVRYLASARNPGGTAASAAEPVSGGVEP